MKFVFLTLFTLKPRANGRNIVGQQLPTLLDVTCCVRVHTMWHVVGCCCVLLRKFWNRSNFTTPNISFAPWSPKRGATMLDPFAQLFQHCWGHACSLRFSALKISACQRTLGTSLKPLLQFFKRSSRFTCGCVGGFVGCLRCYGPWPSFWGICDLGGCTSKTYTTDFVTCNPTF